MKGFASAKRKVCVCDRSDAIRGVAETHFSEYGLILDLMHALGYAMNASRGVGGSHEAITPSPRPVTSMLARRDELGGLRLLVPNARQHVRNLQSNRASGYNHLKENVART